MEPSIIKGGKHSDNRGRVIFNNDFHALGIKRIYTLENINAQFIRAWQGHKIEQRWFTSVAGSFKIKLIRLDNWDSPSKNLPVLEFTLTDETLDVLHVPANFVSSIQALEENSKLLVFADYDLGEIADEYRFPSDYF